MRSGDCRPPLHGCTVAPAPLIQIAISAVQVPLKKLILDCHRGVTDIDAVQLAGAPSDRRDGSIICPHRTPAETSKVVVVVTIVIVSTPTGEGKAVNIECVSIRVELAVGPGVWAATGTRITAGNVAGTAHYFRSTDNARLSRRGHHTPMELSTL